MFKSFRRLFRKKPTYKKYDECAVKYALSSILSSTIDRRAINKILEEDLKPVVGQSFINEIYEKINAEDKKSDKRDLDSWMEVLDSKRLEE